jgi:hypothetical protein
MRTYLLCFTNILIFNFSKLIPRFGSIQFVMDLAICQLDKSTPNSSGMVRKKVRLGVQKKSESVSESELARTIALTLS